MIYFNEPFDISFTRHSFPILISKAHYSMSLARLITTPAIFSISRQSTSTIFSISILLVRIKFHKCNGTYTRAASKGKKEERKRERETPSKKKNESRDLTVPRSAGRNRYRSKTPRGRARYLWRRPIAIRTANRANSQSDQAVFNSGS